MNSDQFDKTRELTESCYVGPDFPCLESENLPGLSQVSYMKTAVEKVFPLLPDLIKRGATANRVVSRNQTYEYESLVIDERIEIDDDFFRGKKFLATVHFFNFEHDKNYRLKPQENTSIKLHDHLLPIGVFPMDLKGRVGEVAYDMITQKIDSSGLALSTNYSLVRYGSAYGLDHPILDRHAVITSTQNISFVLGETNGIKNTRASNLFIIKNEFRQDDLENLALKAHEATTRGLRERNAVL